jgi:hypothetical protein|tara:strand:+ start:397 stop:774 length:378 start_codon:yes stop_codon:yes gene_type:complete
MIKTINKEELDNRCLKLIGKTLKDLGQPNKTDLEKFNLSLDLAKDLKYRYSKLSWKAVVVAFDNGVRETDLFMLCPKTWCKWLNNIKQRIAEAYVNEQNNSEYLIDKQTKELLIEETIYLLKNDS